MTDWKTYKGQYPWPLVPIVDKTSYNEGNKITTSSDPVWKLEDNLSHTPITTIHEPCSYWPKSSVPNVNPRSYTYILVLTSQPPYAVARVNYYSGIVEAFGTIAGASGVPTYFSVVYNNFLYVGYTDIATTEVRIAEFSLVTMAVTRTLTVIPADGFNGIGVCYLSNNLLYLGCTSNYYNADSSTRIRIHEIDLSTFTNTRSVGVSFSRSSYVSITSAGSILYGITQHYIISINLATFGVLNQVQISGNNIVAVAYNNEKTECFMSTYDYYLRRATLAALPVELTPKLTTFLVPNQSVMTDSNNYAYFGYNNSLSLARLNMNTFDTPTTFSFVGAGSWTSMQSAEGKGYLIDNTHDFDSNYSAIVKLDLETMLIEKSIIPGPPAGSSIQSVILA